MKEKTFKTLNGETQEYDIWKMSDAKDIKKKKRETSGEQLRRNCKTIAQELTDGKTKEGDNIYVEDFMEGVYDIEWITHRDHSYKAARLMVAGLSLIHISEPTRPY